MTSEPNATKSYAMRTEAGRVALARRYTNAAVREFDRAIEARLEELQASDPDLCALILLRPVAVALPEELLARGWTPLLAGPDEPIKWRRAEE
jgi:hypothetical protein